MPRLCIFCGDPAEEFEHAIPRWIPKHLGQTKLILEHRRGALVAPKVPFARYGRKMICGPCNRHFGKLEDAVIPLIEDMLHGIPAPIVRVFQEDRQKLLACWGAKTAYTILGVNDGLKFVPDEHLRKVRFDGVPHENVLVGFGRYLGGGEIRIIRGATEIGRPPGGSGVSENNLGYNVVAAFGQFFLKVHGVFAVPPDALLVLPTKFLMRVWPVTNLVAYWPPRRSLDNLGLDIVTDWGLLKKPINPGQQQRLDDLFDHP